MPWILFYILGISPFLSTAMGQYLWAKSCCYCCAIRVLVPCPRAGSVSCIQAYGSFPLPFFTVQLSHPYITTGKTIALTTRTFVGKGMSLLLNMLSRLVITFLPRNKRLLISWLPSPSAVMLGPPKIKSDTVSTVSPSISHEVMGPDAMILVFWILSFKPTFSFSSFTFN